MTTIASAVSRAIASSGARTVLASTHADETPPFPLPRRKWSSRGEASPSTTRDPARLVPEQFLELPEHGRDPRTWLKSVDVLVLDSPPLTEFATRYWVPPAHGVVLVVDGERAASARCCRPKTTSSAWAEPSRGVVLNRHRTRIPRLPSLRWPAEYSRPPASAVVARGLVSGAAILFVARVAAMGLGLAQAVLLARHFGTSASTDAFFVGYAVCFLFVAPTETGLMMAFVPAFVHTAEAEGEDMAWSVAAGLARIGLAAMIGVALVLMLASSWLAPLVAPGFDPATQDLVARFVRLLAPIVVLVFVASMLSTTDYISGRYVMPGPPMTVNALAGPASLVLFADRFGIVSLSLGAPGRRRDPVRDAARRLARVAAPARAGRAARTPGAAADRPDARGARGDELVRRAQHDGRPDVRFGARARLRLVPRLRLAGGDGGRQRRRDANGARDDARVVPARRAAPARAAEDAARQGDDGDRLPDPAARVLRRHLPGRAAHGRLRARGVRRGRGRRDRPGAASSTAWGSFRSC